MEGVQQLRIIPCLDAQYGCYSTFVTLSYKIPKRMQNTVQHSRPLSRIEVDVEEREIVLLEGRRTKGKNVTKVI